MTVPDNITGINELVFNGCYRLVSLVMPTTLTKVSNTTFRGTSSLTSLTFLSTTPPTFYASTNSAFYNSNNVKVYVPASAVDTYKNATGWSEYASRIFAIQE